MRPNNEETPTAPTVEVFNLSVTLEETDMSTNNEEIDIMTIANSKLPVIAGVEITTDSEGRFNLNALHKASSGKDAKRPKNWLQTKQAQELIGELRQNSALGQEVLKVKKGGTTPGTFAHELLAVSYAGWISPSFQLQVNQTFIDYRSGKLASVHIPTTKELALMVIRAEEEKEQALLEIKELGHKVEEMQPDVDALERIAKSDGSMCVTDAAKQLQVRPKFLFNFLEGNRWIYRRIGNDEWTGYQDKIQTGYLEHKVTVVEKNDGTEKSRTQVRVTPKGITKLAKMFSVGVAA